MEKPELYFPRDIEWREWLHDYHKTHTKGVYLIFYKVDMEIPSMRWEEAVKVALCYGWIDSTVKSLGQGKRKQYFCPRNPKSTWSALNKKYVEELDAEGLIHTSGWEVIENAKELGTWSAMDDVENLVIPPDLHTAFQKNPSAFQNYQNFSPSYQKSYLSWLFQAKRETTRIRRIDAIISYCNRNIKTRP
ncbi:MAG: hypothetical protein CL596_09785 [Alteromonas sp.]|nr:hypothetical protein [Alteromonas sp.]MAY23608.1 hypothetical protein [Flavobacteriaceae bacterium]|tara:strand:+ start:17230 stop:17799 length:570 start_codon:yes stop_codon:yes gene_type:complete